MSCFFRVFITSLAQRLRRVRSWALLLLLPCLLLCVQTVMPKESVTAPVQVGVALPDSGAEALWAALEARSGTVLTFIQADGETIDRNIAAGRWDCGVIVSDDFAEKLEEADTDRLFTLRIGTGSTVYPLVQETVSACMAGIVAPGIAEDYLTDSGIGADSDIQKVRQSLMQTLEQEDRVVITMTTYDGEPMEPLALGSRGLERVLCWTVSAMILIWLLLSTHELGLWSRTDAVKRMLPIRSITWLMCGRMAADWVLITLSGCAGVLIAGGGFNGCAAVMTYGIFWAGVGIVIPLLPGLWEGMPLLPPFAVVCSLLFSGALLDVGAFLPRFQGILRWMPCNLFLQCCDGSLAAGIPLIAAAAALTGIAFAIENIKKR